MKALPVFRRRPYHEVRALMTGLLTNKQDARTTLSALIEREDHSFRVVFEARYFVLNEGETEPSKSQWNNLKKKFKRVAPFVFIFKEHGSAPCEDGTPGCYYIDFGYFVDDRPDKADQPRKPRPPAEQPDRAASKPKVLYPVERDPETGRYRPIPPKLRRRDDS
jgi:hypothetical protein